MARERMVMRWGWAYVVILSTVFLVISGFKNESVQGVCNLDPPSAARVADYARFRSQWIIGSA